MMDRWIDRETEDNLTQFERDCGNVWGAWAWLFGLVALGLFLIYAVGPAGK